jgi:hypothetical protein
MRVNMVEILRTHMKMEKGDLLKLFHKWGRG